MLRLAAEAGPEEAYGERREELIFELPRDQAPAELAPGDIVGLVDGRRAIILEVTDEVVHFDANHVLAGEVLTFEIELLSIE